MDGVKHRLGNAVAWLAFLHSIVCGGVIWLELMRTFGYRYHFVAPVGDFVDWYMWVFFGEVAFFLFSPAIWFGMYVLTGSPRILPWMRPEQNEVKR